jgi:hypothetical protein
MKDETSSSGRGKDGRFKKGHVANPKGRARKDRNDVSPLQIVMEELTPVTQNGVTREVTARHAMDLRAYQEAIGGKRGAIRRIMTMIEARDRVRAKRSRGKGRNTPVKLCHDDPANAEAALLLLGIASLDPARPQGEQRSLLLEPSMVQAALSRRRGGRRLSKMEVSEIKRCTRAPEGLRWPRSYDHEED